MVSILPPPHTNTIAAPRNHSDASRIVRDANHNRIRAFTLIELSITLVIIGLLVGGVLVGRDLIGAAQARSQITQFQEYATAVTAFKGKYDCMPGDCEKASNFNLGSNGNGDGLLETATTSYGSNYTRTGFRW